jgi:outer membrane murein-binding lipoprotein Lpp
MSNEEIERAIDFLLKSQATSEARIDRLSEQVSQLSSNVDQLRGTVDQLAGTVAQLNDTVAQLGSRPDSFADNQANIMRVMMQSLEAQARSNESMASRQSRTEDALVRLAEAQTSSDRRLEALIKIVEEGRGGG